MWSAELQFYSFIYIWMYSNYKEETWDKRIIRKPKWYDEFRYLAQTQTQTQTQTHDPKLTKPKRFELGTCPIETKCAYTLRKRTGNERRGGENNYRVG